MDIDFVVTWVDGSDQEWIAQKNKYNPVRASINTEIRYRDYGTFKYFFRSIEKYAPWVHKIYVVTCGHYPEWLNDTSEKIVLVKHSDYIPEKYLPTFNSNPIEINLNRIQNLSEHFVLFNDDTFLMNSVSKEDFFYKGLPKTFGIYSPITPYREFSNITFNNVRLINRNFNKKEDLKRNWKKIFSFRYGFNNFRSVLTLPWGKVLGYKDMHLPMSHLKSTMDEVWNTELGELSRTSSNKFRTVADVNHWVFNYWNIEKGSFYPQSINFGKLFTLNSFSDLIKNFDSKKYKTICINDDYDVQDYEIKMSKLVSLFEKKFPEKSRFEK